MSGQQKFIQLAATGGVVYALDDEGCVWELSRAYDPDQPFLGRDVWKQKSGERIPLSVSSEG